MIRLAARLAAGGGRSAVVGLLLTAVGVALGVTLLLTATAAWPALHQHDVRRGWLATSPENAQPSHDEGATDPLLWRLATTRFDGRDLVRVDVAALGPDAPVPPGLDALPSAGEVAASPALVDLFAERPPEELRDRFPGEVTSTVGREALASPEDLVVVVGHEPAGLRGAPDVVTVRSIETAPRSLLLTRAMRLALAIGAVGLIAPILVFVATATRLQAASRERRLAAMRLAGATRRQIGVVAGVEAAIAALLGVALGFGCFLALRPTLARVPLDGASFYPSDLALSWGWSLAVALGVPALSVAAAVASVRRLGVTPLGIARRATRQRPSPRPLLLVAAGVLALLVIQATMPDAGDVALAVAVGGALAVTIAGIVRSGPWFTAVVARGVARIGRGPSSLLAARRLEDDPAAGFRAISGVVLAVFVGTVFSSFAASELAMMETASDGLAPGVVAVHRDDPIDGEVVHRLGEQVAGIGGVDDVVLAHALPTDPDTLRRLDELGSEVLDGHLAMACEDATAIGLEPCEGTVLVDVGIDVLSTGVTVEEVLPPEVVRNLPVRAVAAVTDGATTTVESVRTAFERELSGSVAVTREDIDADSEQTIRTTRRVSDIALAATLVIAGCSLTVNVAGAMVERRRALALLRLAGTRLGDLRRMVLAEAAAPLLVAAAVSIGLGLAITAVMLGTDDGADSMVLPEASYWVSLAVGIAAALLVVLTTLPLLRRISSLESARFD